MANIHHREDHEYTFWTEAFGLDRAGNPIKVHGKEHYNKLMKAGGFVDYDEAQRIAQAERDECERNRKPYTASAELMGFIQHIKNKTPKKDGSIDLSGNEIAAMKKFGVSFGSQEDHRRKGLTGGWE